MAGGSCDFARRDTARIQFLVALVKSRMVVPLMMNLKATRRRGVRGARLATLWSGVFALALLNSPLRADPPDSRGTALFETRIRPVLVKHCYKCHSDQVDSPKGGLRVDSRKAIRMGGESGHAVVPNDVEASVIIGALRYETFEMPPSEPLDESVVEDFETWIRLGAPDPRDAPAATPRGAGAEGRLEGPGVCAGRPPLRAGPLRRLSSTTTGSTAISIASFLRDTVKPGWSRWTMPRRRSCCGECSSI